MRSLARRSAGDFRRNGQAGEKRMKVIVAKTAGFCFGVKRAMDLVYSRIRENAGPIYTLGSIIHNEEVVRELEPNSIG